MAESPQTMWKRCLDIIRNNVNEQQYETWFSLLQLKSFDVQTKELTVYVPSQYFHEYLEEKFSKLSKEMQDWAMTEYAKYYGDAERTAQEIRDAGGEAVACFGDISDYEAAGT